VHYTEPKTKAYEVAKIKNKGYWGYNI
jgi:hypothetical protein